jgi:hypothetical protein
MARHGLPRPFPLFRDRLVSGSLQLLLHLLELCPSTTVRSWTKVTGGAP